MHLRGLQPPFPLFPSSPVARVEWLFDSRLQTPRPHGQGHHQAPGSCGYSILYCRTWKSDQTKAHPMKAHPESWPVLNRLYCQVFGDHPFQLCFADNLGAAYFARRRSCAHPHDRGSYAHHLSVDQNLLAVAAPFHVPLGWPTMSSASCRQRCHVGRLTCARTSSSVTGPFVALSFVFQPFLRRSTMS